MKAQPLSGENGKVLVIDDNPIIQRTVYFQGRNEGFNVVMCGDLTESLAVVRREKPDIIVLDINFPAENATVTAEPRDGFWAAKWFRHLPEASHIPIILISTADPAEAEPRALAAGAAAFLAKPLDKEKLISTIRELMAVRKPETEGIAASSGLKMA